MNILLYYAGFNSTYVSLLFRLEIDNAATIAFLNFFNVNKESAMNIVADFRE